MSALAKSILDALSDNVQAIVDEEAKEAATRVETRVRGLAGSIVAVRGLAGSIVAQVSRTTDVREMSDRIVLTVHFPTVKP